MYYCNQNGFTGVEYMRNEKMKNIVTGGLIPVKNAFACLYDKASKSMKHLKARISGFTLAEILIALTVVGVVSALTIPTLMNRYQEKTFNQLTSKEKLNILNTLDMIMTDEGKSNLVAVGMNTADGVEAYLKNYYRVNTVCGDNPTSKKCLTADAPLKEGHQCVKTNDGATICMTPLNNEGKGEILVDVNAAQGPNIAGKDIVQLAYLNDGGLGKPSCEGPGCINDSTIGNEYILYVKRGPSGVESVTPTQVALAEGKDVTIGATYTKGWQLQEFKKASGNCTVDGVGKVTMGKGNCTVQVLAAKIPLKLIVNQGNCETASGNKNPIYYGDTATISAESEWLGKFLSWTPNAYCTVRNSSQSKQEKVSSTIEMTEVGDCVVTASCQEAPSYSVILTPGNGCSSISPNNFSLKIGRNKSGINVEPAFGHSFDYWTSNANCTVSGGKVTMKENATGTCSATANCKPNEYQLNVNRGYCESASGSGKVVFGQSKSVSATAGYGKDFTGWSASGRCTVSGNTVTMNDTGCTVTAKCQDKPRYTVTVSNNNCSSASGGGTVFDGESVSARVTAGSHKTFSGWSGCGQSSSSSSISFTPTSSCTLTANCSTNKYTITVAKGTCDSASGGGTYTAGGSALSISATAPDNASFTGWTAGSGCSVGNSSSSSTTASATSNCTVTANCSKDKYTITVAKGTCDSASGGGEVEAGTSVNISATAAEGAAFTGWTVGSGCSVDSSSSSSTTASATKSCTVTASCQAAEVEDEYYTVSVVNGEGCSVRNLKGGGKIKKGENASISATSRYASGLDYNEKISIFEAGDGCTFPSSIADNGDTSKADGFNISNLYPISTRTTPITVTPSKDCTVTAYCYQKLTVIGDDGIKKLYLNGNSDQYGGDNDPKAEYSLHRSGSKGMEFNVTYDFEGGYDSATLRVTDGDCTVSGNTITFGIKSCTVKVETTPVPTYKLTVTGDEGIEDIDPTEKTGLATGDKTSISYKVKDGYTPSTITVTGGNCSISDNEVTMGTADCSVNITSEKIAEYKVTGGILPDSLKDKTDKLPVEYTVRKAGSATLEAEEISGWTFKGWNTTAVTGEGKCTASVDKTDSHKLQVTNVTGDCGYNASYEEIKVEEPETPTVTNVTVRYSSEGGKVTVYNVIPDGNDGYNYVETEGAEVNGAHEITVAQNDLVLLDAKSANTGYKFKNWEKISGQCELDEGEDLNNTDILIIAKGSEKCEYIARFEANKYTLTVHEGWPNITKDLNAGDTVKVTHFTGKQGTFTQWSVDSGTCKIDNPKSQTPTITMEANDCVVSNHVPKTLKLNVEIGNGCTVDGRDNLSNSIVGGVMTYYAEEGTTQTLEGGTKYAQAAGCPEGCTLHHVFDKWTKVSGNCTISNEYAQTLNVTMGTEDCKVKVQCSTTQAAPNYANDILVARYNPMGTIIKYYVLAKQPVSKDIDVQYTCRSQYDSTGFKITIPKGATRTQVQTKTVPNGGWTCTAKVSSSTDHVNAELYHD